MIIFLHDVYNYIMKTLIRFTHSGVSDGNLGVHNVSILTDQWIHEVTATNNSKNIYNLFCSDGNLLGTVSQTIRYGQDIKRYFDYFANLKNIQVIDKKYNVSKVADNVYLNTAFITWKWDDIEKPIIARMSFLYRGKYIFQLHSSVLPNFNINLQKVSGTK